MRFLAVVIVLAACGQSSSIAVDADNGPPTGPSGIVAPATTELDASIQGATMLDIAGQTPSVTFDLGACAHDKATVSNGLGHGWFVAQPIDAGAHCEIWLGGETENPGCGGAFDCPASYCEFDRHGHVEIVLGGPAHIDSPFCVSVP